MKIKLIVVFAALLFAGKSRADEVSTTYGGAYIPDGSLVTSINYIDPGEPEAIVLFSFADGTGEVTDIGPLGAVGSIMFTTPVSGLSFTWFGPDFSYAPLDPFTGEPEITGTTYLAGPLTYFEWGSDNNGLVGIESMTYTVDTTDPAPVPEPSALLLEGLGLVMLVLWAVRKRIPGGQSAARLNALFNSRGTVIPTISRNRFRSLTSRDESAALFQPFSKFVQSHFVLNGKRTVPLAS